MVLFDSMVTLASHLDDPIAYICWKPNALLHELSHFVHEPPSHTILVSASRSGKARWVLDVLWNSYCSSLIDSNPLGSSGIQSAIQTIMPNDPRFHPVPPLRRLNTNLHKQATAIRY